MSRPNISIISLGGTIAMTKGNGPGVVPVLGAEQLIGAVPALADHGHITAVSLRQLPSAHLSYADLEALAALIRTQAEQGQQGFVVTQGTDTLEESAFILDRLLDISAPVVLTGAMRNPDLPGADGPANLLAAVQVAASPSMQSCGCVLVMNDEIHAARFVQKTHSSRPDAFRSLNGGPLGWLSEGQLYLTYLPARVPALSQATVNEQAWVALISVTLGDSPQTVQAVLAGKPDGLVIEAPGGGHVTPAIADCLASAAQNIPVVVAARTRAGTALQRTYGYIGSEIDLQARGLLTAGWLDAAKAKALLTLLLRQGTSDVAAILQAYEAWGGGRHQS